jgi:hypothetical protein
MKNRKSILARIVNLLGWTKTSYFFLSGFVLLLLLVGYVWWPLVVQYLSTYNPQVPIWRQVDWLLVLDFLVMSLLIMANADLKSDIPIVVIGFFGGLVIESWGTQTELWTYYTFERPPLWIIPAWPIASLSIDRLYRLTKKITQHVSDNTFHVLHWTILPAFYVIMLLFVWPTVDKSLTIMALLSCAFMILTPPDNRSVTLTFIAGIALGYFLELWGTTRLCWTYYTLEQPPFFAVLAHGMAAVAFWRVLKLYQIFQPHISNNVFSALKLKKYRSARGSPPDIGA